MRRAAPYASYRWLQHKPTGCIRQLFLLLVARAGAPVRYYDACDPQDAPNINATENPILKAFAEAGVLRLGESCAIECLDAASPTSDRLCQACKDQKGLRLGDAKCDGKKAKATERRPWVVPWAAKQ